MQVGQCALAVGNSTTVLVHNKLYGEHGVLQLIEGVTLDGPSKIDYIDLYLHDSGPVP